MRPDVLGDFVGFRCPCGAIALQMHDGAFHIANDNLECECGRNIVVQFAPCIVPVFVYVPKKDPSISTHIFGSNPLRPDRAKKKPKDDDFLKSCGIKG